MQVQRHDSKIRPVRLTSLAIIALGGWLLSACGPATDSNPKSETVAHSETSSDRTSPNVVFILVDDLGYSDIGAYNPDTFYETPNIDRLASQGVQFMNGYAVSPICSPTRAALMAGRHPTRMAATDWFHKPEWPHNIESFQPATMNEFMALEEVTIAEAFKEGGYETAFLGKWHLGLDERYWPEHQGFNINIGGHDAGMPLAGFFSPYENPRMNDGPDGEYLTNRLTDEAINLIDQFDEGDDPFFLYLSYYTVHIPIEAPAELVAKYEAKGEGLAGDGDFIEEEQHRLIDEPRLVRVQQNDPIYAGMIESLDTNVGRILDKLDQSGLDENTIVVFTSDNGGLSSSEGLPTSNLPLRTGKGWIYEGGIRVPLIVRAPGAAGNGTRSDAPVTSMDFYPTLLELTGQGARPDQHIDGLNFTASLNGGEFSERPLFFHYPHYSNQGGFPGGAVRLGDFKLIHNLENGEMKLFNLSSDLGETKDLSEENSQKFNELRTLLLDWYAETDARFLRAREDAPDILPWRPTSD